MKLLFVPVLLISMVVGTWAINCYTCTGTGCSDPFDSTATGVTDTCDDEVIPYDSCAACVAGICNYCCTSDLCNGGTTVTTSFVAMGVAMLAAFILARQ